MRLCTCGSACACVYGKLWITRLHCMSVSGLGADTCVVLEWMRVCRCLLQLFVCTPLVHLCVLLCADAWPLWEHSVIVWWVFLKLSSVRWKKLHKALNVPFFSGGFLLLFGFIFKCTCLSLVYLCNVPLLCVYWFSKWFCLFDVGLSSCQDLPNC